MNKLFIIKNRITGKPVPNTFFDQKSKAKTYRNELNTEHNPDTYHISYGPDHRLYK